MYKQPDLLFSIPFSSNNRVPGINKNQNSWTYWKSGGVNGPREWQI